MSNIPVLAIVNHSESFDTFRQAVNDSRFEFFCAEGLDEASSLLNRNEFRIILYSISSLSLCRDLRNYLVAQSKPIPIIVLAQQPSVEDAVSYVHAGAVDYLSPPFDKDKVSQVLSNAVNNLQDSSNASANCGSRHDSDFAGIIGRSEKMQKVFSLIEKVCETDTTVLIRGESGTGKELIAQALHFEGARKKGPFIPVNCGAIPAELLESELFGHEKGAFTHAIRTRIGRFEMADGGTVFLDEISEMSPMLQVKILRVLQERKFERIGGTKTIASDFRVIAATNRNLEEEVNKGRFRQDLYYRLNVIPIEAPPLRDRASDIELLLGFFIEKFSSIKGKKGMRFSPEAYDCFLRYPWPGNVRELENVIERVVILASDETIGLDDLPERLRSGEQYAGGEISEIPEHGIELNTVMADFEKRLIIQALGKTDWVKNRAAKLLHINRTTLLEKMKRYHITAPEK